jgi:hypothetical protein
MTEPLGDGLHVGAALQHQTRRRMSEVVQPDLRQVEPRHLAGEHLAERVRPRLTERVREYEPVCGRAARPSAIRSSATAPVGFQDRHSARVGAAAPRLVAGSAKASSLPRCVSDRTTARRCVSRLSPASADRGPRRDASGGAATGLHLGGPARRWRGRRLPAPQPPRALTRHTRRRSCLGDVSWGWSFRTASRSARWATT